jgi:hypothetical protein
LLLERLKRAEHEPGFAAGRIPGQRPYVAFVVSPSLIPFARRLAQLLGGSLAHGSAGLIPFIWPLPSPTYGLQRHAIFAVLGYKGDHEEQIVKTVSELRSNDEPLIQNPNRKTCGFARGNI